MNFYQKTMRYLCSLILALLLIQPLVLNATMLNNVDINVDQDNLLDIVLTLGKTDSIVSAFDNDLKTALVNKGIPLDKIKIQAVKSSDVSAGNTTSGWETYDHTNYTTNTINYYRPYYSEVNGNYVLYNHIVPTITTSTNIDFYGYGAPAYKDFMYMPNTETGKKTFDFTIQEGVFYDALNGAGFLFNTAMTTNTNLASRTMSGYLVFFLYPYSGAPTVKVYKFTNIDVNAFHNSASTAIQNYSGFTEIASYTVGTEKTRKVKIEATADSMLMWYNDVEVNFTLANATQSKTVPLTTDFGAYGFGPLVGYLSHGCGQPTHFTFYNVKMSTESSKRFSDVIREPEWRDQSKRFIINAEDGAVADFSDSVALGEILARLGNESISYIGWGKNETDGNAFITKNSGNGLFVDKDSAITDTYSEQIQAMADYIYQRYIDGVENDTEYLVYGKPSSLSITPASEKTNTIDANWPQGKWRIDHLPNYFENSTGSVPYDNLYLNNLDISFTESGKYNVYYQDSLIKSVYVHRKPIAKFQATVDGSYNLTISDLSYDPDQASAADRGIKDIQWSYKLSTATSWTTGKPTALNANNDYIIRQIVKDEYGIESEPYLRFVSTKVSATSIPMAEFNITPSKLLTYISSTVTYLDSSYDPKGVAITQRLWTITKDGSSVYSSGTAKTNFSDFAGGVYKITLKVMNADNQWSQEVSRYLTVVKDTVGVSVTSDTASGSFNSTKNVLLTFTDDANGSGFSYRYVVVSNSNTTPTAWGSMGTNSTYSYTLSNVGSNYIHYKAYDYAGNVTTGVFGPFTLTDIQAPSSPTLTYNPDYVPGTWSNQNITVAASGSTDDFTAGNALVYSYSTNGTNYTIGNSYTITTDGNHTIYFKVTDGSGNNVVKSTNVKIDKTAPSDPGITLTANGNSYTAGTWTSYDVSGVINGSTDSTSQVKQYEFKINSGQWSVSDSFAFGSSCNCILYYRALDNAGNYSNEKSVSIKLDKTLPEAFVVSAVSNAIDSINISASTFDFQSGLAPTAYRYYNGSVWSNWMSSLNVEQKGYTRGQSVNIVVEARDVVGNVRQASKTVTTLTNKTPTAVNDNYKINEDSGLNSFNVLSNDIDEDFNTALSETLTIMSISDVSDQASGTLTISNGKINYSPALNYNGSFSFKYTIQDSYGSSSTGSVEVEVTAANDQPGAVEDNYQTDEDQWLMMDVLSNDYDVDSSFWISEVSSADNGTVEIVENKVKYTPNDDYNGLDKFTYTITDGELISSVEVTINVKAVNDAPVALNDEYHTDEDHMLVMGVMNNDYDIDSSMSIKLFTDGAHGKVVVDGNQLKYSPDKDFNGADSFTYTITDGVLSAIATVKVTVDPVNDAPMSVNDQFVVDEDVLTELTVLTNDYDIDSSTYWIVSYSDASHGQITKANGKLYYLSDADYNGSDSFTYTISDGELTHESTVDLTVSPVNDAPVAVKDEISLLEDQTVELPVTTNDIDVDSTYTIETFTNASYGTVQLTSGKLSYTPVANYNGKDTFTYTISDGELSATVEVLLTIEPVNDAPVAMLDSYSINEDILSVFDVLKNDSDLDNDLIIVAASQPPHGLVTIVNNKLSYKPDLNFNGEDQLTYTIGDGEFTATVKVQIMVKAVNDAPVVNNDQGSTDYNKPIVIDVVANDTDVENDMLSIVRFDSPKNGKVVIVNNQVEYSPNALFAGTDQFVVYITDGAIEKNSVVTIEVATPSTKETTMFDPRPTVPTDPTDPTDPDPEVEINKPGSKGEIIVVNDVIYYTPKPGVEGLDTYTFEVNEGGSNKTYQVLTNIENGKATVLGFGTPLSDEAFEVANNETLLIDLSKYLNESAISGISKITVSPRFGTIEMVEGKLKYRPSKDYIGMDGLILTVTIGDDIVPFAASINVVDSKPFSFPWLCLIGWIVAAAFLFFNYKRHQEYFEVKKANIISYIVINTVVILTLCLLHFVIGYPIAIGLLLVWLILNYAFYHRQYQLLSSY
jgi:hypothetical protein